MWGLGKVLFCKAEPEAKLQAWCLHIVGQALHDCRTWHLNRDNLQELRRWELKWLKKTLRLRPITALHEQFDRPAYNDRTALWIYKMFFKTGCKMAVHKTLAAIHREAYREMTVTTGDGSNPLLGSRANNSAITDKQEKQTPAKIRRIDSRVRARRGPPASKWELPLTMVYGNDWRALRATKTLTESAAMEEHFVATVPEVWGLKGYWARKDKTNAGDLEVDWEKGKPAGKKATEKTGKRLRARLRSISTTLGMCTGRLAGGSH